MNNIHNIGVFFGSRSPEHDVSIITAKLVIANLQKLGYEVTPIYITKKGKFVITEKLLESDFFTTNNLDELDFSDFPEVSIDLKNSFNKIVLTHKTSFFWKKYIAIDLAFPCFHGSYGEDGVFQGFFDTFNIPYVGCEVMSSGITMNKTMLKHVLKANNIPTPEYVFFTKAEWKLTNPIPGAKKKNDNKDVHMESNNFSKSQNTILEKIKKKLSFPVFVKPAKLGSSIAIQKCNNVAELEEAIEVALFYDEHILLEQGVQNLKDLTICLIGNDTPEASLIQESVFKSDLFDFNEKYLKDGGGQTGENKEALIIPAKLSKEVTNQITEMAKAVYKIVHCTGIARVDFLLDTKSNIFYVAEVNPLPGTIYHHLWEKTGVNINDLLKKLLNYALERHDTKQQFNYNFKSDILKNMKKGKLSK